MDEELNSCELGTKAYWDSRYEMEIKNYTDHGDVGEIWFDESSQDRVINWLNKQKDISSNSRLIDLGSGNGMMLIELANEGFTNMVGIDYSQQAVDLANKIIEDKHQTHIKHFVVNIVGDRDKLAELGKFLIVHDKGTYDAISLSDNSKEDREQYYQNVCFLLEANGILVLTSCNFTELELEKFFVRPDNQLEVKEIIPTPQFKFGGKVGSVVTSIVLRKKS